MIIQDILLVVKLIRINYVDFLQDSRVVAGGCIIYGLGSAGNKGRGIRFPGCCGYLDQVIGNSPKPDLR